MPRNPAASRIGTPRCISQVAAVWRNVCGVTFPGSLARIHGRFEALLHGSDRLAIELDEAGADQLAVFPTTQMRK
nr:hypothetical protein [Bradyrhizobium viridifuturi]